MLGRGLFVCYDGVVMFYCCLLIWFWFNWPDYVSLIIDLICLIVATGWFD